MTSPLRTLNNALATILCFPEEYSFAFMLGAPVLLSCSASSSSFV